MFEFKIEKIQKKICSAGFRLRRDFSGQAGQARTGFFITPHGKIQTPNLAVVATHGKIKLLNKADQRRANPDFIIANTFHLFVNNKIKEIKKAGGLHQWAGFKKPIMTDSGGFQVFSLGWGRIHRIGKISKNYNQYQEAKLSEKRQYLGNRISQTLNNIKISEKGADFIFNGEKCELTPEKSIKIQSDLGADIVFAFDECTSPLHSYAYTKKAAERTHRWAVRCLAVQNKELDEKNKKQALFGIVQGGVYEDLRKKSSKFIGSFPFDGFGIGGCFGEKQMGKAIGWSIEYLPEEKPRHLLGIGKIRDVFIAVQQGIDLFDCVVPTREARHGVLYTRKGKLAIKKNIFANDKRLIEKNCGCWVCRQGIRRREIHQHFKRQTDISRRRNGEEIWRQPVQNQRRPMLLGGRLATIHNIYFFKNLFREIRGAISENKLEKLERMYYNYY